MGVGSEGVVAGVDVGRLEGFRAGLKQNPTWLGLEAKAVWEGTMGRSTVHIGPYELAGKHIDRVTRHYTVPYGAWREVEEATGVVGPTDRQEPVEMALGALASCLVVSISYNAYRQGIGLDGLQVKVRTRVSPEVLFALRGPDEHPSCLETIEATVTATGRNLTPDQLDAIKRLAEHSPVHGLLSHPNRIATTVARGEPEAGPDAT